MNPPPALSVVVPLYNEEQYLLSEMNTLADALDRIVGKKRWMFVFVENGSIDATPQLLSGLVERYPPSMVVTLDRPNYGHAVCAGLKNAPTEWTHTVDVEFWDVPFLHWAWSNREPKDIFIASKRADPSLNRLPAYRRFLSWGMNGLVRILFGYPGSDIHGPKLIRMDCVRPLLDICTAGRGQFEVELIVRAYRSGARIFEAPVPIAEKRTPRNLMLNKIRWNAWELVKVVRSMGVSRSTSAIKISRASRADMLAVAGHDIGQTAIDANPS